MNKKHKRINKALSMLLAALMTFTTFAPAVPVFAANDNGTVTEKTETWSVTNYHFYEMDIAGSVPFDPSIWSDGQGFDIPFIYAEPDSNGNYINIENEAFRATDEEGNVSVAYCLNDGKAAPHGDDLDYNLSQLDQKIIRAINAGYPKDSQGFGAQAVSQAEFEWATAVAVKIVEGNYYNRAGERVGDARIRLDEFDLTGTTPNGETITTRMNLNRFYGRFLESDYDTEFANERANATLWKDTVANYGAHIVAYYKLINGSGTDNLPAFLRNNNGTIEYVDTQYQAAYDWISANVNHEEYGANLQQIKDNIDNYINQVADSRAKQTILARAQAANDAYQANVTRIYNLVEDIVNYANSQTAPLPIITLENNETNITFEGTICQRGPFNASLENGTSEMLIKVEDGQEDYTVVDSSGAELQKTTVAGVTYYKGSFGQDFYVKYDSDATLPTLDNPLNSAPEITVYAKDITLPTTIAYEKSAQIQTMYVYDTVTLQDAIKISGLSYIKVFKTDLAGNKLPNVAFDLYADRAMTQKITTKSTDTDGNTPLYALAPGATYYLKEVLAPEGYITPTTLLRVTAPDEGKAGRVTITNEFEEHDVEISKTILGGAELEGASMKLTGTPLGSETEIEPITWTSGTESHVVTLKPGSYVLHEDAAPAGYAVATDIPFTLGIDGKITVGNSEVEKVNMEDAPTKVVISKKDITETNEVAGALLQVIDSAGVVVDEWTSTSTPHEITGVLVAGATYTLHEEEAPEGYVRAADVEFTVNLDGTVKTVVMKDDYDYSGEFTVSGTKAIEGADSTNDTFNFILLDANDNEVSSASVNGAGTFTFDPVTLEADGTYTYKIKEVAASTNDWEIDDTVYTLTVTASKNTTTGKLDITQSLTAQQIKFTNTFSPESSAVKISKVGINGQEIAGATLKITGRATGANQDITPIEWTSEAGKTKEVELQPGTYTLHESGAPDGYILASDITFTVDANGRITIGEESVTSVTMTDDWTKVSISKKEIANGPEIEGALLQVLDSEGNVIDEWTSTSTPHEINAVLVAGETYTLHEENAPDGYFYAEDMEFTVNTDGSVNSVIMTDDITVVRVLKTDIADGGEVEGATLQVLDSDGNIVDEWVSTDEAHIIEGLIIDREYTLKETVAPHGYTVATETTFVINADGSVTTTGSKTTDEDGNTVLLVEDTMTEVKILKADITGEQELSGAHLQILNNEGDVVLEWDSTDEARVIKGLQTGKEYTLRETVAPDGYTIAADTTFVINDDGAVSTQLSMTDDGVMLLKDEITKVIISKIDIADGEELEGAHLQVLNSEGDVVDEWDSSREAHEIEGLIVGEEYTLKETVAPNGYTIATDTTFTIDESGRVTTTASTTEDGVILVEDSKTKVLISKVDIADGAEVEGAHLQVLDSEGNVVDEWTSTGDTHQIEGLLTGETYTLRETVAPDGYTVTNDITFVIDQSGRVTTTGSSTADENGNSVLLVEDAKTKVSVSKVDIADGEELEGAHIQVIDSEGNIVEEWDSVKEPHEIEGLLTGEEYILRETVAPDGYTITTDTSFTISEDGRVTSTGTVTEDGILLVEDTKTQVLVKKTDIASGEELEGATLQILDSEGNIVEEWVSTKDAHEIEGLLTGEEYTLRETVAPDGYAIATDTTFTIDERGNVTSTGSVTEDGILLVEDDTTKVSITKTDITGDEEIPGATLQVLDSEGNIIDEWVSTTEAHNIEGILIAGETYTLHEENAPDGYAYAEDAEFTVNADGTITTVTMKDDITRVSITKTDITSGEEIEGAHLQVIDSEGNIIDEWTSTKEAHDINGVLIAGATYVLHEEGAPDGYSYSSDIEFTVNLDGTVKTVVMQDEITKVAVTKTDITGEKAIEGATLQVIDKNGNVIDEWTSTKEAHIIEGLIADETYTLHEANAPEGYAYTADATFTVNRDSSVQQVVMKDDVTKVHITKTDITGDEEIPGAHLQVLDSEGNVLDEWTSVADATHEIVGLLIADETYILHEENAPNGYAYAEDVEFTVNHDGTITEVSMQDDITRVSITKTDITGKEEVEGATLQVFDSNGEIVDEWVSTKEVHEINGTLIAGAVYTLHEENAPDGYAYASDIEFTVNRDGSVTTVIMKDDVTKVSVTKTDITGDEEIPGAHLQVLDSEGNVIDEWTSTKEAHIIEGLIADNTYTLHEEGAPDGYAYAEDMEFTVNHDGTITEVTMQDKAINVVISKVDVDNVKIAGAALQILDSEGNVVEEWVSEEGESHTIAAALVAGSTYILHEAKAPEGYAPAEDITFTISRDGKIMVNQKEVTEITMLDQRVGSLVINKTVSGSMGNKTDIFDFTITLKDKDGNLVNGEFDYVKGTETGKITFVNGVATFKLGHLETIEIQGLIEGYQYKVEEADYSGEGYKTTSRNDEGTITNGVTTVSFTNSKGGIINTGLNMGFNSILISLISLAGIALIFILRKKRKA